jgi:hypothetical protein
MLMRVGDAARWVREGFRAARDGLRRERRAARRFPAASRRGWLGWPDGDRFVTAAASLKDVSLCGLAARTEAEPAAGDRVWVCLGDRPEGPWVIVEVVVVERDRGRLLSRRGPNLLRLRFVRGCPYTFFHEAVAGRARPGRGRAGVPPPAAAANRPRDRAAPTLG